MGSKGGCLSGCQEDVCVGSQEDRCMLGTKTARWWMIDNVCMGSQGVAYRDVKKMYV